MYTMKYVSQRWFIIVPLWKEKKASLGNSYSSLVICTSTYSEVVLESIVYFACEYNSFNIRILLCTYRVLTYYRVQENCQLDYTPVSSDRVELKMKENRTTWVGTRGLKRHEMYFLGIRFHLSHLQNKTAIAQNV